MEQTSVETNYVIYNLMEAKLLCIFLVMSDVGIYLKAMLFKWYQNTKG